MLCYIDVSCVMHTGQMSERSKETVLKTVEGQPSASSNLALSASGFQAMDCMEPFFHVWNVGVPPVSLGFPLRVSVCGCAFEYVCQSAADGLVSAYKCMWLHGVSR